MHVTGRCPSYRDEGLGCWITTEDMNVTWQRFSFTVRSGFEHDYASVPQIVSNIIPKVGDSDKAVIAHDWAFCHRPVNDAGEHMTRAEADKMFRDLLRYYGVARWKRRVMYRAVRLFGGRLWRRHDREFE